MNQDQAYRLSREFLEKNLDTFTQENMEQLGELIAFHSALYYEAEQPIISDSEYDSLFKILEYVEEKYNVDIKVSQKVGVKVEQSSFAKVAHSRPMISLDNTYNEEELRDFDKRIKKILGKTHSTQNLTSESPLLKERRTQENEASFSSEEKEFKIEVSGEEYSIPYTIEFKFDGLGIELIYDEGKLIQAITRGDGVRGEDVTENIKQIKNIPQKIEKKGRFEVRGEVVMPISSFERLNEYAKEHGEKIFSNPRNAASGSLRVLDTSITKKRDLKYFAYDVSDFSEFHKEKYSDMIYYLESLGFEISSYFQKCAGIQELILEIEKNSDIKKDIDFEVDGLVVKVNDISLWKKIGFTQHHPRYAIAYKFPAEIVTTRLLKVEHSVGRTGTITPVAHLEAVTIGGAIIRRATLHNYDEVEKLGVKIGDIVFLKRAGEVIPKIISVASSPQETGLTGDRSQRGISPPKTCPSCGSEVLKDENKVRFYCSNSYGCPAQMGEKLAFAVGKQGFNIDGFGEKQAQLFLELGFIKNLGDIFRLKNQREEILALDGFQEKSVNNLLEGIEKVREMDIVIFLKALGIPGVGKRTAKTLSVFFSDVRSLQLSPLGRELELQAELESLPDIGPEVAKNIIAFFDSQHYEISDLLQEVSVQFPNNTQSVGGKYSGKKMCITGSFEGYSRDDLVKILEEQGGEFVSSVSNKTDFLLVGEKAGSKLKKAEQLGVEILSLEEFL